MAEKEGFEPSHRLPDLRPFQGRLFSRLSTSPKNKMAPQVGFEPTTDRLTADSSTTELLRNNEYYFLNLDSALVRQKPWLLLQNKSPTGRFVSLPLSYYGIIINGGPKWTRTIDLTLIRRAL